jgi:hypothetical protein
MYFFGSFIEYFANPFRYSFGFCHASTVGLHTGLHNMSILSRFGYTFLTLSRSIMYNTRVVT